MDDDVIGFTYFLNLSYKQHQKDFPHDQITFHEFSSICLNKWESLDEEPKKKVIELAKKEHEEIKKERNAVGGEENNPIELESEDDQENKNNITFDVINVAKVIEIGETIKKNFGKHYTYCKKPRSAYIYFVKAAHLYCKNQGQCSRENFVEITRAISVKWNEMKVSQRKVFEDCALLDKRFNGFKCEAVQKKKIVGTHTSLFLKAKQEARDHHATVSTAGAIRLNNQLASTSRRSATSSRTNRSARTTSTRTRRKVKRKKKRKTTTKSKVRVKSENRSTIKRENKPTIKTERKFTVKKECKVKREF